MVKSPDIPVPKVKHLQSPEVGPVTALIAWAGVASIGQGIPFSGSWPRPLIVSLSSIPFMHGLYHVVFEQGIVHCIRSVRESFQELSRSQGEAIVTPDFIDSLSGTMNGSRGSDFSGSSKYPHMTLLCYGYLSPLGQLLGEKVTPQAMMELMAWKGAGRGGGGNSKSSVNGDDRPGAARATPNLEVG